MGTVKGDEIPLILLRTTSNFSYLVAGGEQDAYVYTNSSGKSIRIIGSLSIGAFTAGKKITVKVYNYIDGATPEIIDSVVYTVGTDPNPHVDFGTFRSAKITFTIDIVEAGDTAVVRAIEVQQAAQ